MPAGQLVSPVGCFGIPEAIFHNLVTSDRMDAIGLAEGDHIAGHDLAAFDGIHTCFSVPFLDVAYITDGSVSCQGVGPI